MTKSQKAFEYLPITVLSVILLVIMHIAIPNMGGTLAHPREYIVWIGIFTLILIAAAFVTSRKALIVPSYFKYAAAYTSLLLITAVFNPILNREIFIIQSLRVIAAVIIWLSLHQFRFSEREKVTVLIVILMSAVIESTMVILKALVNSYAIHSFGISFALAMVKVTKYIPDVGGAFQQKNLFASWAATGIAISVHLITTERFKLFGKAKKALFLISAMPLAGGLFLANSRIGLIGLALAILALLISNHSAYLRTKKYIAIWIMIFFIGTACGFYVSGTKTGPKGLVESADSTAKEKVKWLSDITQRSYVERLILFETSYEMFKDKPLFGYGYSNFSSVFMHKKAKVSSENPLYKGMVYNEFISHPHNEFFNILAECGIAGMLALGFALFGIFKMLYKAGRVSNTFAYAMLLIPVLMHTMVEYPLELSASHFLLFIILLFMVTSDETRVKEIRTGNKATAAILIFFSVLYLGLSSYTVKTFIDYRKYGQYKEAFMNGEALDETQILPATKNIYLKNWAEPDYMFRKALNAALNPAENMDFINSFLLWNAKEKIRRPGLPSYNLEGLIYYRLGEIDPKNSLIYYEKSKSVLDEGLALYPNDHNLTALRKDVVAAAIGNYIKKTQ
ncbi:MAG: O-antigen ligase C-terminal domain-containing protein [Nitrospirae bacterium]|nr:O-antigen ligase C-terminal domain-containing protein [Nitrospirota bacterium]